MFFSRHVFAMGVIGLAAAACLIGNDANAQQVFRIVGPDGRVTFSDKPPLDPAAKTKAAPMAASPSASSGRSAALPFQLRQVADRYPVTLYSAPGCGPCASGRAMLAARGVPFTEKSVITNEDIEAFKRIAGVPSLPVLGIGAQQLKGYSDTEWTQFLDAAGYPKSSVLPAAYAHAPATPLVALQEPQQAATRTAPEAPPALPPAAGSGDPAPTSPTGIRF